MDLLLIRYH